MKDGGPGKEASVGGAGNNAESARTARTVVRLQKFLAECGVASRRAAETLIAAGRVKVNGRVAQLGQSVAPGKDRVEVDGRLLRQPQKKVYLLFNKPAGVITSAKDPQKRATVLDFVRGVGLRVFPVGRLDYDTEGALILTNDGELAYRLMHPRYQVDKVYMAWVEGRMTPETARRLEEGVQLEDGLTAPAKVTILHAGNDVTMLKLTLHEGRKREVRRMLGAVGHPVRQLQRVAFGTVQLKGLRPGEWRYLSESELRSLRRLTGLG
jgi:23S rRNA pseudouridine2605 synthase